VPVGRFVYGKSYLARVDKVPTDPIELKLGRHVRATCRGSPCEYRRIFKRHATTRACSAFVIALTPGFVCLEKRA
jgi:hypothetical protein